MHTVNDTVWRQQARVQVFIVTWTHDNKMTSLNNITHYYNIINHRLVHSFHLQNRKMIEST